MIGLVVMVLFVLVLYSLAFGLARAAGREVPQPGDDGPVEIPHG